MELVRTASNVFSTAASFSAEPQEWPSAMHNAASNIMLSRQRARSEGEAAKLRFRKAGLRALAAVRFMKKTDDPIDAENKLEGEEEPLVGQWMDSHGTIVTITENSVVWRGLPPYPLRRIGADNVSLELDGTTCHAELDGDRLVWEDNEVWYRLDEAFLEQLHAEKHARSRWLARMKVGVVHALDVAFKALVDALSHYPFMFITLHNRVAFLSSSMAGDPTLASWRGPMCALRDEGYLGLFYGFAPFAASRLISSLLQCLPNIIKHSCTGRPLQTRRSRTVCSRISRIVGVIPVMLMDIAWIRMLTCHGPEYETPITSISTVLSSTELCVSRGIFRMCDVPLWLIFAKALLKDLHPFQCLRRYLPEHHHLAERRGLYESVSATPAFVPRFLIMPCCMTPLPNFTWNGFWFNIRTMIVCFPLASLFGQLPALTFRFIQARARAKALGLMFEDGEHHLQQKLQHAQDHVAGIKGHVNLKSLRKERPLLTGQPSGLPKDALAKNMKDKFRVVQDQLKSHAAMASTEDIQRQTTVVVDRCHVIESLHQIARLQALALQRGKVSISYKNELGSDYGGLFRDYMQTIGRCLSDSNLFEAGPDGGLLPVRQEGDGVWREQLFAVGRLLALALIRHTPLDIYFSRCMYKVLLGEQITASDIARIDPEFYKHRIAGVLRKGGVAATEAVLCDELKFVSVPLQAYIDQDELVPNGRRIRVTEENKGSYIAALVEHYLLGRNRKELAAFVEGFHDVIPRVVVQKARAMSKLTSIEFELMITGLPTIDVAELKRYTKISTVDCAAKNTSAIRPGRLGIEDQRQMLDWFWEVLTDMDAEYRAKVLSFTTGSGRLPHSGVRGLSPPLEVKVMDEAEDHLPSAHTCFNQICLPMYTSKSKLEEQLQKAVKFDSGFGFV